MSPAPRRSVEVEGRRTAYLDIGLREGVPLVLLHGAGFDHADLSWRPTIDRLEGSLRIVAPDIPGYGQSEGLDGACSLPRLGRWVAAFLDATDLGRVDLAGVSMGGGMALWLALEQPGRVRRLVPVCPYGIMPRAPFHPAVALLARLGLGAVYAVAGRNRTLARLGLAANYGVPGRVTAALVSDLMEVARDQYGRRSFEAFLAAELGAWSLKTDLTPRLAALAMPTLLVAGSHDRIVSPHHVRRAAALIPGARLLELPTGHWPMCERDDLFAPALREFLAP